MQQKNCIQKQTANADCVNNLMRQKTLYMHAQYWQSTIRKRHDRVCAQIHFNIWKETVVNLHKKHWYKHVPKSAETNKKGKVTILWNKHMQTSRTIPNNKPDIINRDNKKGTCILIDVISGDKNMINKWPRRGYN